MAKVIKYHLYDEENEENLIPVEMGWNETNEEIAKCEAYRGEYTIEDDGKERIATVTLDTRVEELESETAELNEALNLLLSGVTE